MISALNSSIGTNVTGITGAAPGTLTYRRLTGVSAVATTAAAAANMNAATIAALLLVGGTLTAAFAGIVLAALGALVGARWLLRQAVS